MAALGTRVTAPLSQPPLTESETIGQGCGDEQVGRDFPDTRAREDVETRGDGLGSWVAERIGPQEQTEQCEVPPGEHIAQRKTLQGEQADQGYYDERNDAVPHQRQGKHAEVFGEHRGHRPNSRLALQHAFGQEQEARRPGDVQAGEPYCEARGDASHQTFVL
mgnify:CR=1 FL=1